MPRNMGARGALFNPLRCRKVTRLMASCGRHGRQTRRWITPTPPGPGTQLAKPKIRCAAVADVRAPCAIPSCARRRGDHPWARRTHAVPAPKPAPISAVARDKLWLPATPLEVVANGHTRRVPAQTVRFAGHQRRIQRRPDDPHRPRRGMPRSRASFQRAHAVPAIPPAQALSSPLSAHE